MCRFSTKQIFETIPHWLLDKAPMIAAVSRDGKNIESGPDVLVPLVESVTITEGLVHVELIFICPRLLCILSDWHTCVACRSRSAYG
jgi:hypothetical protein